MNLPLGVWYFSGMVKDYVEFKSFEYDEVFRLLGKVWGMVNFLTVAADDLVNGD